MMHKYNSTEMHSCFAGKRILLTGDSIVRETFWALVRQMGSNAPLPVPTESNKHTDIHITVGDNIHLDFYWDPYLNSTGLNAAFHTSHSRKPVVTIAGTGLWHAKNLGPDNFKIWKNTIDDVAMLSQERRRTESSAANLVILLPLLEPDYRRLSEPRQKIAPVVVARMNAYLEDLSTRR